MKSKPGKEKIKTNDIHSDSSDDIEFADEHSTPNGIAMTNWKVLVVDDEEEVHEVTRLALRKFRISGRGLDILSAYSGEGAKEIIKNDSSIALILLDVVMEDDHGRIKVGQIYTGGSG